MKQNLLYSLILLFIVISFNCKVNDPEAAKTGSISGKVTNDNGDSITNAIVFTIPATGTITSDSAGKFVIGDVLPGTYTIKATKTGYDTGSVVVNVIAGTITGADVKITNLGAISGRVSSTVGDTSIRNATIITKPATMQVTTDTLGRYTINNVTAGNYTVTAYKTGYDTVSVNAIVNPAKATVADLKLTAKQNPVPALGLVAYYPFNGNANDESGNGNNGTVYGATLSTDRFGNPNAAYNFNRSDTNYISVSHNNIINLTGNYSFSVWLFQKTASSDGYRILDKSTAGSCDGYNLDTYDGSSGRRIRMDIGCPWTISNTIYSLNQWHHIVVLVNSGNVTFYLDGQQDGTGTVGGTPTNTLDLFIGTSHPVDTHFCFDGMIDDICIYNRILTNEEIQKLYH